MAEVENAQLTIEKYKLRRTKVIAKSLLLAFLWVVYASVVITLAAKGVNKDVIEDVAILGGVAGAALSWLFLISIHNS